MVSLVTASKVFPSLRGCMLLRMTSRVVAGVDETVERSSVVSLGVIDAPGAYECSRVPVDA